MEYPGSFETPAFPAGKQIAVSRLMSILAMIAFFIITVLAGILIWSYNSQSLEPFIISTDSVTGEWVIVGKSPEKIEHTVARTMQESMIAKYVEHWFTISDDYEKNDNVWKKCTRASCTTEIRSLNGEKSCPLYCASGEETYSVFSGRVIKEYTKRMENKETWTLNKKSLDIIPTSKITNKGGNWKINADVTSNIDGKMKIIAFIKVEFNKDIYPETMGFYIYDFNAYRIK